MLKKILIANRGDQQAAGLRSGGGAWPGTRSVQGD